MANIKSQKKRILVSRNENARNSSIRSRVRNAIKKFNAAIDAKDVALAEQLLPETESIINKAKSDGVVTANSASRKVAAMHRALNSIKA